MRCRDWSSEVCSSDLQRHGVGYQVVDVDLAVHVPVDDLRHVGAPLRAAEGGALPDPAGDELEGPCGDLRDGGRHADDRRLAPALVAALERLAHHLDVADALEGMVGAALRQVYQIRHDVALRLPRVATSGPPHTPR